MLTVRINPSVCDACKQIAARASSAASKAAQSPGHSMSREAIVDGNDHKAPSSENASKIRLPV